MDAKNEKTPPTVQNGAPVAWKDHSLYKSGHRHYAHATKDGTDGSISCAPATRSSGSGRRGLFVSTSACQTSGATRRCLWASADGSPRVRIGSLPFPPPPLPPSAHQLRVKRRPAKCRRRRTVPFFIFSGPAASLGHMTSLQHLSLLTSMQVSDADASKCVYGCVAR
ncbi:uncharacterized protein LOC119403918 isoform X1 [Rhipicephalus sanguineus]|uniref:uncharacterized protein LOC119403918 isoform X1 n=1 Tax=Rhipicephalus sanguineus TaxID=34632 RepID=UPI0020C4C5F9|nr:uncharacterized protein LOC119403918 isoform X1 [Rhipicephalus sanguineus]